MRKLACGVVVAVLVFATWAETYTWTGGSGNWEDGAHWVSSQSTTGTAPGAGDKVVLPAVAGGCTILVNQSFSVESIDIGDKNNAGGTVKLSFNHNLVNTVSGDIHVYKGATLTHEALSSTADTLAEGNRRVWIEADGDIHIEKDSLVEADGKGYDISKGPGGNNGYCAGGFHATLGQAAGGNTLAATEDGPRGVYGSFRSPTTHGSGGTGANGRGGGVIRLKALGTLRLDGVVRANGCLTSSYGPGAGGSAWLTAGTISGAGSVSAYSPFYNGGGGRISLVQTAATDWTAFTGTIVTVSTSVNNRIAPSIYLESAADAPGRGELRVTGCRNNGYPILFAPRVTDAEEPFGTVAVKTYGKVEVRSGMTLRVTKAVSAGGSSFASGEGTVELMPAAGETMTVSGTLEMKHLVITNAGGTVSFAKNCTVKSADDGTLKLAGTAAAPLTLTGTNGTWKLTVGAHVDADVSYVSVSNCNSSAGAAIADVCGTGLGGTANWYFTRPAQAGDPLVWTGASGNTDWQNAGNWRDRYGDPRAPTATDVITIPAGCSSYPVLTHDFTVSTITNETGASLTLNGGDLTLTGDFICAGAFTCRGSETWTLPGTVNFTGATVSPGTSLGVLNAAGAQCVTTAGKSFFDLCLLAPSYTLLGGFDAHEVTCDQNAAVSLTFGAGDLFKATKFKMIVGTGSISLASTSPGTYWRLAAGTGSVFEGVTVNDSNASWGDPVCTVSYTGDHNLNWRKGASVWTGAEDTAWTNSNNWTGSVPDADSDVFVQGGTSQPTLSEETTVRSLRIGDGALSATLTVRAALTVREGLAVATNGTLVADAPITVTNDVTLSAGAKMTHTAGDSTGNAYRLDVTTFGDFTLDAAAGIDVVNRGYARAKGPGGANGSCSAASYASIGGYFERSTLGTGIYGSVRRPDQCGSGGDSGAGGGAVRLRVAGTLALNGTVNANASRNGYGGGTGGSVWLTAGTIRGTGRVTAVCVCTGTCSFPSGGRISLVQTAATDWTAFTGTVAVGPDASTRPGTVYRETAADRPGEGELEISGLSGNTMPATEPVKLTAAVTDAGEPFGRVTVKQYGRLTVDDGVTLRVTEALNAGGSSFTTAGDGAVELRPPAGETLDLSGGTLQIKHLVVTNAGSTVSVAKDTVVTNLANGTVTLKGTDDAPLVLTGPNGAWKLSVDANAVQSVAYVDVSNCNSLAGAAVTDLWGNDLGGTKNWMFTRPVEAGARLTWTGAAGTTSWIEGGNWEDDKGRSRPPMETDVFVIPAGCEVYPVIVDNFTANTISNQANASLTLGNNCKLTVTGDFICAGAFVCNGSEAWSVAGTVDFTGATVTPRTSTGTLNATSGVQTVTTAGKTFYDLVLAAPVMKLLGGLVAHKVTCDQNDAVALSFEAQKLFKADQFQVLVGTGSVALESTVPRTQWRLSAGLGSIFDGVSVSDSDASYGEPVRTISFTDRGNNVNWFTGVRRWTGAEDADWANAANWEGGVPGSGSDVVVQEGATTPVISAATGVRSLVVGGGTSSAALTVRAPLSVGMDMVLLSGGTLTADAPIVVSNNVQLGVGSKVTHTAGGSYRVDITALGDIAIDAGASVDVLNRGYGSQKGPGGANGYCSAASYVCIGGYFDRSTLGTGVYGSFRRPDQCGSGGDLGAGGGAVHLCAGGTLTLNGTVDANSSANGYGGGTGGSVWFEAGTICGSGTVTALHVRTEVSSYPSGGRVSFVQRTATDWTAFTGTVNVGPSARSRVGSFYRETAADRPGEGTLEVVGCSGTSMEATEPVRVTAGIADGGETFGRVTVKGYGRLYVETGATLRVSSALTMAGSSWDCPGALEFCPHPGEQLAVTGTFTCSELVCTSALGTVAFAPGARMTVGTGGRQVKLRGDIGRRLTLKSATEGEAWYVSVSNDVPTDLRYLTVSDSDASGGKTMVTKSSGDRKGRNVNWELSAPGTVIVVK